jgi:hypothetical protein
LLLLTCVYIIWATSSSPSLLGRTCSTTLVLRFCWRENIKDNKKDTAFLLVWDKNSYTERFLVLLPCLCVFHPTLICLYQTSSLPSHSGLCHLAPFWMNILFLAFHCDKCTTYFIFTSVSYLNDDSYRINAKYDF